MLRRVDICDAIVAIVNSGPKLSTRIRQVVHLRVESSIPDVQSTHEGDLLIHNDHFLMVRPHERNQHVIRMHHHTDVCTQTCQILLCELRINGECKFRSVVDDNIHLYSCLCYLLKDHIQSILLLIIWPF